MGSGQYDMSEGVEIVPSSSSTTGGGDSGGGEMDNYERYMNRGNGRYN